MSFLTFDSSHRHSLMTYLLGAILVTMLPSIALAQDGASSGSTAESGSTPESGSGGDSGGSPPPISQTLGYNSVSNQAAPTISSFYTFTASSNTAFIVPFQFTAFNSGLMVNSVSLLLAGDGPVNGISVSIYGVAPTNSTVGTPLMTFTGSGDTLSESAANAYTFTADSAPTLLNGTTYSLRVGYTGTGTAEWAQTTSQSYATSYPGFLPVANSYAPGTAFVYRLADASGSADAYNNMGGFSITANAVSAVPEPAATAAAFGAVAILAGLVVRWRRHGSAPSPETGS